MELNLQPILKNREDGMDSNSNISNILNAPTKQFFKIFFFE